MTVSGFDKGEERGPASCSGTYHDDMEFVMTVSTKLYTSGGLCGIMFRITSTETGRSTMAEVVDECHDCRDDQVGAPAGVWGRLGLDTNTYEYNTHFLFSLTERKATPEAMVSSFVSNSDEEGSRNP
ncbi:putative ripening-related protein 6 [Aegilops tauschii subsp. strangulata]|uniref:putative ripening-related protein 6 n=1 Tax=Aegilops tauschii subsp. strangulata TaxID=200361 RepID=UPI001ABC13E6|nr:putative ripening-related protein 6 [Aegilops tauschii subsp. strangulata]